MFGAAWHTHSHLKLGETPSDTAWSGMSCAIDWHVLEDGNEEHEQAHIRGPGFHCNRCDSFHGDGRSSLLTTLIFQSKNFAWDAVLCAAS